MNKSLTLLLGDATGEHIQISVLGREHPQATDYWDANWLESRIAVRVGGWSGSFVASLQTVDFQFFREQLDRLYRSLHGKAEFRTMEPSLHFVVSGDKLGRVTVEGQASDAPGVGNQLQFRFSIDQSYLPAALEQLAEILRTYPVVGQP